jgi:hypothetical protein
MFRRSDLSLRIALATLSPVLATMLRVIDTCPSFGAWVTRLLLGRQQENRVLTEARFLDTSAFLMPLDHRRLVELLQHSTKGSANLTGVHSQDTMPLAQLSQRILAVNS